MSDYFQNIPHIPFEGKDSSNPLSFKDWLPLNSKTLLYKALFISVYWKDASIQSNGYAMIDPRRYGSLWDHEKASVPSSKNLALGAWTKPNEP